MIYNKEANFPYPVLSPQSFDYNNFDFNLKVNIEEVEDNYKFTITYTMDSPFIKKQLINRKAKLFLIIETKDAKIFELKDTELIVAKSRISLKRSTKFQLFIAATGRFTFMNNSDLDEFYDVMKKRIVLDKGNILAYSNVENFTGELKKPYELFDYAIDSTIKSDIQIRLTSEMIVIVYKTKELRYVGMAPQSNLNYHYVYMGLQKALLKLLFEEETDTLVVNDVTEPKSGLSQKLVNLLSLKHVTEVNFENLDEMIHKISDSIILKHFEAVRGLRDEN